MNELALCNWLLKKRPDATHLKEAVRWKENWYVERGKSDKREVQLTLVDYLDAEEYATIIQRYEQAGLKARDSLGGVKGEAAMSLVIARHRSSDF